jgi:hypothetical protein
MHDDPKLTRCSCCWRQPDDHEDMDHPFETLAAARERWEAEQDDELALKEEMIGMCTELVAAAEKVRRSGGSSKEDNDALRDLLDLVIWHQPD